MEILHDFAQRHIKAAVFDWDGTVSVLREGWESVMRPLMLEMIDPSRVDDPALIKQVSDYIDDSTGIQTIFQMRALRDMVAEAGVCESRDEWEYKAEYNRRLMVSVNRRVQRLTDGELSAEDYMIKGSKALLQRLCDAGVKLYVASGTDHGDVCREIKSLGMDGYFTSIAGAPEHKAECGKEKIIRALVEENGLGGEGLAVFGDGKVEIALGREYGAFTVGVASDEKKLCGVNAAKREKLIGAGADMIIGDYCDLSFLDRLI